MSRRERSPLHEVCDPCSHPIHAAEGHPASVMDMSFSNQALGVEFIIKNRQNLENKFYVLPKENDIKIATLKLKSMGIEIDTLTPEMIEYLNSWQLGT